MEQLHFKKKKGTTPFEISVSNSCLFHFEIDDLNLFLQMHIEVAKRKSKL